MKTTIDLTGPDNVRLVEEQDERWAITDATGYSIGLTLDQLDWLAIQIRGYVPPPPLKPALHGENDPAVCGGKW